MFGLRWRRKLLDIKYAGFYDNKNADFLQKNGVIFGRPTGGSGLLSPFRGQGRSLTLVLGIWRREAGTKPKALKLALASINKQASVAAMAAVGVFYVNKMVLSRLRSQHATL